MKKRLLIGILGFAGLLTACSEDEIDFYTGPAAVNITIDGVRQQLILSLRNRVRYLTFTAGTKSLRADLKDIIRMFLQMLR